MTTVRRIPSLRKRFVARARYLQTHRPFRDDIRHRRQAWNDRFPPFAIGEPGVPPPEPWSWPPPEPPVPDKLRTAIAERHQRMVQRRSRAELDDASHVAAWAWRELLRDLCLSWWSLRYYPITVPPLFHPAHRFVAGCLLWRIDLVPDAAVAAYVLEPIVQVGSPAEPDDREAVGLRAERDHLLRRLAEAITSGTDLSLDVLNQLVAEAARSGEAARQRRWHEIREASGGTDLYEGCSLTFPLFPGLARADWSEAEPGVFAVLQAVYPDHPGLATAAGELKAAGMSIRAIAGELGVSRDTIRHWLHDAETLAK